MSTIAGLSAALADGSTTAVHLTEAALAKITACDPTIRAFITVAPDCVQQAQQSDKRRAGGQIGRLEGIPVAIKDNIDMAGLPTTDGTGHFAGRIARTDAHVTARLRAAGAIILGKLNMHEGALGATTDNRYWGRCDNPMAPGHTPGGSSGGSAAAVAAGYVPLTLGTDTLGSVRIPAAYCGLWGLKPTCGLIGRSGLSPLSWTLDTIGPITGSAADLALALDVLAGTDPGDPASLDSPVTAPAAPAPAPALTLGVPDLGGVLLEPEVQAAFLAFCARLTGQGVRLVGVRIQGWNPPVLRRAGLLLAEAEAGHRLGDVLDAEATGFSPEFRALIAYGHSAPAARLLAARQLQDSMRPAVLAGLAGVEALLVPTAPQRAFAHGVAAPPGQADLTALASAAGLPAVAFPIEVPPSERPVSAQLIGRPFADQRLIALAKVLTGGRDAR